MNHRRLQASGRMQENTRATAWQQESLLESESPTGKKVHIPPPLYHDRLRKHAEAARSRRALERQLRGFAQLSLIILGAVAGALLVLRALSSVAPPDPDSGSVVNLLRSDMVEVSANLPREIATARAAFVDSPFGQLGQEPLIRAAGAILVDLRERTILYGLQPHQRRAPASLTKIATAIVALEQAPVDTRIQVPANATTQPDNRVGLQPNEIFSLRDLLYAMWLPSGNDATVTVADGIGGEAYTVAQMNGLADRLDLQDTHFVNTVGYDDAGQYTTPYELAVIAADAMERFPLLARISRTKTYVITAGIANRSYSVTNLNGLLWSYAGTLGGKTGRTEAAGGNIVVAAERDGRRLLCVVMGSSDRTADAETLLNHGFQALAARG